MNLNCVYPAQAQVCLNSHLFNYFLTFPFRLPDRHLKLFLSKTELPTKPCVTHPPPISVDGNFILWVTQAKSIEVILDSSLSHSPPIQTTNRFCWQPLWNISRIDCFSPFSHPLLAPTMVWSTFTSHRVCCRSLPTSLLTCSCSHLFSFTAAGMIVQGPSAGHPRLHKACQAKKHQGAKSQKETLTFPLKA